jgi:hypothetical protein
MDSITQEDSKSNLEEIEILESYVLDSRVHEIIDNPTDEVIPEG